MKRWRRGRRGRRWREHVGGENPLSAVAVKWQWKSNINESFAAVWNKTVLSNTMSWREGVRVFQVSWGQFIFKWALKKKKNQDRERLHCLFPTRSSFHLQQTLGKQMSASNERQIKAARTLGKEHLTFSQKNKCSNICWTMSGVKFLPFSQMHIHSVPPSRRVWSSYTVHTWEFYVWENNIFLADCLSWSQLCSPSCRIDSSWSLGRSEIPQGKFFSQFWNLIVS